jgi:hypothetical protein
MVYVLMWSNSVSGFPETWQALTLLVVLLVTEVVKYFAQVILFFILAPTFTENLCTPDYQYNYGPFLFSLFAIIFVISWL